MQLGFGPYIREALCKRLYCLVKEEIQEALQNELEVVLVDTTGHMHG